MTATSCCLLIGVVLAYNQLRSSDYMGTKDILKEIRTKNNLTQDEMAERLFVTRQAVSRWENGDMTPNTEILKEISKKFDVSINTLLGSPRKLICQCCGMPLEDDSFISREKDKGLLQMVLYRRRFCL